MKVGVIIFIVLICGIVLVELVSLEKSIADKHKKKQLEKQKQNEVKDIPVSDMIHSPEEIESTKETKE